MPLSRCDGRPSRGWIVAAIALTLFIWGNSLVPATGSSRLSLAAVSAVRELLALARLPNGWVTNFLIRKGAHFTEYAALGILVSQALAPGRLLAGRTLMLAAVVLLLVPCIDETIQLFVPGRFGLVTDVLLDCSGAAAGAAIRSLVMWRRQVRLGK